MSLALSGIAAIFLFGFGLNWLTSRSKAYRAWAVKQLEREKAERASRPKPPWADDPVARSIEWTGTSEWGADQDPNPRGAAVRIRSVSADRIEFQPISARGVHAAILLFGVVAMVLVFSSTGSVAKALLALLVSTSLSVALALVRRLARESLVFDRRLGLYWRGRSAPAPAAAGASAGRSGRIADVHALQLVATRRFVGNPAAGADSDYREFPTYELNLVLKDGTRLSTVCLDDLAGLDHDARILADFLQRPLWNACA